MAHSYSVINLGCKVNRVESDAFEAQLAAWGLPAHRGQDADVIIVNTCTVTADAEKKTRKAVRRAVREHPCAHIIVTGCSVAIDPATYQAMGKHVHVVSKQDLERKLALHAADADPLLPDASPDLSERIRRGVKVQDGCDNACTYCIVHTARGRARSVPVDEVIAQCADLIRAGIPEIMLTGIDLGAYRFEGEDLAALVTRMLSELSLRDEEGHLRCRLRISSIEPQNVTPALMEAIASSEGALCAHLHLPLQSGSSKVLSEMGRRYDAEGFRDVIGSLRRAMPHLSITTDVIAGFPGETEEDFDETVRLCEDAAFSKMHVFPYSKRQGTPAAARADQVPEDVKEERAAQLRALSDTLRARDLVQRVGTTELAVVEAPGRAMTESYHEVSVPTFIPPGAIYPYTF